MAVTYTVKQQYIDAFGLAEMVQLTNLHDRSASDIDDAVLSRNREQAFAVINAYITPTYGSLLPFSTVPPLLNMFELNIVRYYLDSMQAREDVRLRYEDAIAQLKLIGKGDMSLGLDGGVTPIIVPGAIGGGTVAKPRAIFGSTGGAQQSGFGY